MPPDPTPDRGSTRKDRPTCSGASRARQEPLGATASRVDHWLLVEYRAAWPRDAPRANVFSDPVRERLRAVLASRPGSRLLFVKQGSGSAHRSCTVFTATSLAGGERLARVDLPGHDALADAGLEEGAAVAHPLFVVCTHGKHDRCCATHGRPLYEALRESTDPDRVWQSTHVGGDRFAGNVVVLPHGLYYGRVGPEDVPGLLAAHAAGRIDLERYRGRSIYPFPVQAAELEARRTLGLSGIDELSLASVERLADGSWRVVLDAGGETVATDVTPSLDAEAHHLTCDARAPSRAPAYAVVIRERTHAK